MIQFDDHIFQMGWFNHHLNKIFIKFWYLATTQISGDSIDGSEIETGWRQLKYFWNSHP